MKPSYIDTVLDLAFRAREQGHIFNPLFVSAPGLGKSSKCQAYANQLGIPFIDIRAAYREAPDMIGFPTVEIINGRQVTKHHTPSTWPSEGRGIVLLEEPNRGTSSVMNCFMQLLTDRKIDEYTLPEGWIIVGCINPENEQYDVNTMDPALKDRFEIFQVDYSREDFLTYMKHSNWDNSVINFVETNTWKYALPEEISKTNGAKYISPRTLSKLNAALKAGLPDDKNFEHIVYDSLLGAAIGNSYYHFKHNEQPVTYKELSNKFTKNAAFEKLKKFGNPSDYKAGTLSITIRDIVDDGTIDDELLRDVLLAMPADLGYQLVSELTFKRKENGLLTRIIEKYPVIKKYMKDVLK